MDNELLKVLDAREERWKIRKALVEKRHSTLITITLCVPVAYRNSEEFWTIFQKLSRLFWGILISNNIRACYEGHIRNADGPACFISTDARAEDVKKICVNAEETISGGRMLDIDVMDSNGSPVSRRDMGLPTRKCFVCDNPAEVCVSRKLHSKDEISARVEQLKNQVMR